MDTLKQIRTDAAALSEHNRRLVLDYIRELLTRPQLEPEVLAELTGPQPKKRTRKTGTFEEVRTIRNRSGQGGKSYKWRYRVTYEDGKRVKSESLGRVE